MSIQTDEAYCRQIHWENEFFFWSPWYPFRWIIEFGMSQSPAYRSNPRSYLLHLSNHAIYLFVRHNRIAKLPKEMFDRVPQVLDLIGQRIVFVRPRWFLVMVKNHDSPRQPVVFPYVAFLLKGIQVTQDTIRRSYLECRADLSR